MKVEWLWFPAKLHEIQNEINSVFSVLFSREKSRDVTSLHGT
jgi:hypothetical protein